MKQTDPQFKLRLPEQLHAQLVRDADANRRSINAEVVHRLQANDSPDLGSPRRTTAPTGGIAPFGLRMLPQLREEVEAAATKNGRSMNAEIVARLGSGGSALSLRDHFAGLAMQAAATNPTGADGFTFEQRAEWAYQQADAMLKARAL